MTREELAGLFGRVEAFKKILDESQFIEKPVHQPNEFCDWADRLVQDLSRCAHWMSEKSVRLREEDLTPVPTESQMEWIEGVMSK